MAFHRPFGLPLRRYAYFFTFLIVLFIVSKFRKQLKVSVSLRVTRFHNPNRHTYHPNGLLEVNPDATHPIPELIEKAKHDWDIKARRQSQSLKAAVTEYTRRYRRPPPKGFDLWWRYVIMNDVQLPDEYDSIHERIEPFWAVDPSELQAIVADWEDDEWQSITFGKHAGGRLQILKNAINKPEKGSFESAVKERLEFLLEIDHLLPEFRAVASPFDNPNLIMDWELRTMLAESARSGEYVNLTERRTHDTNGWLGACGPDFPARRDPPNLREQLPGKNWTTATRKVFIHDHLASMDPCLHPSHLISEGQFISHKTGPGHTKLPVPQFSFSPTSIHYDLPFNIPLFFEEVEDIPWSEKYDERLLWRGRDTGMNMDWTGWQNAQRPRLVQLASNMSGTIQILPPPDEYPSAQAVRDGRPWKKSALVPRMMDIAFGGKPATGNRGQSDGLQNIFAWQPFMSLDEANGYKYVIDVDGNAWSSRFRRLMLTNSLIFKSTVYPEWFTERIQPWLHYIPITVQYTELYDALIFFTGEHGGHGRHDALAEQIATAGRLWAERFYRKEDCIAYMFRLILEYARVMSTDRQSMDYVLA